MAFSQDPVNMALQNVVKDSESAKLYLTNITALEKNARELLSENKKNNVSKLDKKISDLMEKAHRKIENAKRTIEFIQMTIKDNKLTDQYTSLLNNLEEKSAYLNKLSSNLAQISRRILLRIVPPKIDPGTALLKDAPKTPNNNLVEEAKARELVSKLFNEQSDVTVRYNELPTILKTVDETKKQLFLEELARRIIESDDPKSNAAHAYSKLPIPYFKQFTKFLKEKNHQVAIQILKDVNVPIASLPSFDAKSNQNKNISSLPSEQNDESRKRIIEAAQGGISKVKEILHDMSNSVPPKSRQEQLDFVRAVREERQHQKLKEALTTIVIPKDEPKSPGFH